MSEETQQNIFLENSIKIGGFQLGARGAEPEAGVAITRVGWRAAFEFATSSAESSDYWVGDLIVYAETREDWREAIDQLKSTTGMAEHTLHNKAVVSRKVGSRARELAPTISHAAEVTKLPREEQEEWLEKARTEGWSVTDLRKNYQVSKRARVVDGQAELRGMYRVIYADPPWLYGDRPPSGKGAEAHYPGMRIEDMCKLPVAAHARKDAVLFLWTTAPLILQTPGPREVIAAWGFTPKTGLVWDKVKHGFGHYVEVRHEHLIIATRGSCTPDRLTPMYPSVIAERRTDIHSEKPEYFRKMIERLYDGPYLELFGRKRVEGWSTFGNDARLWAGAHAEAKRA